MYQYGFKVDSIWVHHGLHMDSEGAGNGFDKDSEKGMDSERMQKSNMDPIWVQKELCHVYPMPWNLWDHVRKGSKNKCLFPMVFDRF